MCPCEFLRPGSPRGCGHRHLCLAGGMPLGHGLTSHRFLGAEPVGVRRHEGRRVALDLGEPQVELAHVLLVPLHGEEGAAVGGGGRLVLRDVLDDGCGRLAGLVRQDAEGQQRAAGKRLRVLADLVAPRDAELVQGGVPEIVALVLDVEHLVPALGVAGRAGVRRDVEVGAVLELEDLVRDRLRAVLAADVHQGRAVVLRRELDVDAGDAAERLLDNDAAAEVLEGALGRLGRRRRVRRRRLRTARGRGRTRQGGVGADRGLVAAADGGRDDERGENEKVASVHGFYLNLSGRHATRCERRTKRDWGATRV